MMTFEERLNLITDLGELEGFANRRKYFSMLDAWTVGERDLILRKKFELQTVEWPIGANLLKAAQAMSAKMGTLKNSITKGAGNVPAFVAEIMVQQLIGAKRQNTFDYDMVMPNGARVDVKTTLTSVPPRYDYDCKVAAYYKQDCDWYAFARVTYELDRAWMLGFYPSAKFFTDAHHYQAGDPDKVSGRIYQKECYVMPLWRLKGKMDEA
jgi:hypothetical protein